MYIRILLPLIFLLSSNLYAQTKSKNHDKYFGHGLQLMKKESYGEALEVFLKTDKISDPDLNFNIGLCYFNLKNPGKAIEYFMQAKVYRYEDRQLNYYLGRAFHLQNEFQKALGFFEDYKKQLREAERLQIAEVDKYITYCLNGIKHVENEVEVKMENLGQLINSRFPEYNPLISADESTLIFTSRREDTKGKKLDPKDQMFYEDIYYSVKEADGWKEPVSIGNKINTEGHDACIGLSADGQQMLIYKAKTGGGDIYISRLEGTEWSTPENLGGHVNTENWESSASLSSNNNVLFFTSNKKGGVGGTDIYMSKRDADGKFGPAILLGPQVNTPDDELAPFIHADGQTLYFSSRGHWSMGGFDIFSVKIDLETGEILSAPVNIGYPINTADDDFNFVWSADNSRAYFSSVRPEGIGDKDIYMLERNIALAPLVVWKGTVHDCITGLPIDAQIIVSDNITKEVVGIYRPNSSSGKYTIILPAGRNYGIAVESKAYAFYSKNIDIPTLNSYMELEDKICLDPVIKGTTINLRNIFFDFDKAILRPESELELSRLLKFLNEYPEIRVEIAGHTDSEGEDRYNQKLSEKRAEAVFTYLIKNGISKKRMVSKGYGESKPVADNETREGRQLNRRTSITIID